ncbi:UvrD-helicase domain-containing protein [Streptomyces sp. H39-C1]|uniref:UvrD-helicase domain-containing protein n=1 Tax=Streptomyces sp. H39-C1 TaxID=3004355 RepID=UPI0022B0001F|nr:UvrD-helicase domain-containing protein [Streptomyces sp. H39-C1]MCZ4103318.1 UvrD-helicase domain-containing protein [Streptomyces sp. H39-C1]
MTTLAPTPEQSAAISCFEGRHHMVLQAGAGTGKTATLEMLADHDTVQRGLYLAFNRAIKLEAERRFPSRVKCSTGHGLAFGTVGFRYKHRFGRTRIPAWKTAETLGLRHSLTVGDKIFETNNLAYVIKETVLRYCHSADRELAEQHVPIQRGAEDPQIHRVLASTVLPFAQRAWNDVRIPEGDKLPVDHDHYLKVWQLTDPHLNYDYVMLDEAQDTNPALEDVLLRQRDHAQLILVGDSAQQIYTWRGARDIMTNFTGTHLTLSQSFRFGPALAEHANDWLALTRSPLRLRGNPAIATRLEKTYTPDAILCRTNGGAMAEVMHQMEAGRRVAMAGGGNDLRKLAIAAEDLKQGKKARHPDLYLFKTWGDLQEYAENDPAGADLYPWVALIDEIGTETVLAAVEQLGSEESSDVTVSTVHKAKGREWSTVRIGEDFPAPESDALGRPGRITTTEARLAYVAVTRARHQLDIGGLSWFTSHSQNGAPTASATLPGQTRNAWDLGPLPAAPSGTGD